MQKISTIYYIVIYFPAAEKEQPQLENKFRERRQQLRRQMNC